MRERYKFQSVLQMCYIQLTKVSKNGMMSLILIPFMHHHVFEQTNSLGAIHINVSRGVEYKTVLGK